MKTLQLSIITIIGIVSLVVLGAYVIVNPIFPRYSNPQYGITSSTQENVLGLHARVVYGINTYLSCIRLPCDTSTFKLVVDSEQGSEIHGYSICNGMSCIEKYDFESYPINVKVKNPQNATGPVSLNTRDIILYNFPWKVGDTVNIKIKAIPVTLEENGSILRYPENMTTVDLGYSVVECERVK
ncbi:MAG: hypothetical protein ACREBA_05365 [Nitrosotalea sp.]